jgi:hypothetical protein
MTGMRGTHWLLWSYPAAWRERYGEEMLAMAEDLSGGEPPKLGLRISLLWSGLKERFRRSALLGEDRPRADRLRAGARTTLVAWSLLVIAGGEFAKFSEHWQSSVPATQRFAPSVAYAAVEILAGVGAAAVIIPSMVALPLLRKALASGGWPSTRRPLGTAVGLLAALAGSTAGLAGWAHHLTSAQRNGALASYSAVYICWGLLIVATVAAWTKAALAIERQLDVSPRFARILFAGAAVTGTCVVATAAAIITWWAALAVNSPWALAGSASSPPSSAWSWPLGLIAALATAAAGIAILGSWRLINAVRS